MRDIFIAIKTVFTIQHGIKKKPILINEHFHKSKNIVNSITP